MHNMASVLPLIYSLNNPYTIITKYLQISNGNNGYLRKWRTYLIRNIHFENITKLSLPSLLKITCNHWDIPAIRNLTKAIFCYILLDIMAFCHVHHLREKNK